MKKGIIVLAPFPFTDLTTIKRRPAIIVSSSTKRDNDVIVAFISSKLKSTFNNTDFLLETNHPDFSLTGLKRTSVFNMDKLVTIEQSIIIGEIGKVSETILKELNSKLKIALDLNDE